ncbi:ArsR family transcriptional regulator [candidate division KSB1 bacterium]|nr:MAG: ArsR family transcriptional regulator [candidate division KSB1 bacterium]
MTGINYKEQAKLLKAIAHPTRLHLLEIIRDTNPCVRSMEEALGIAQPTVSQHLSILRNLGIVESERQGHQVCYKIKNKTVLKLLDSID